MILSSRRSTELDHCISEEVLEKVAWDQDSDLVFVAIHFVALLHHQASDLVLEDLELREKESPDQPIAWNRASVPLHFRVSDPNLSEPSVPNCRQALPIMSGPSVSNSPIAPIPFLNLRKNLEWWRLH